MTFESVWQWLQTEIFSLPSVNGARPLFNFYRDEHPDCDLPGAAAIRRENLRQWLAGLETVETLVVGEAPGWRGCRFTGIPFTSEALLLAGDLPFAARPTHLGDRPLTEASATLFQKAFHGMEARVFTWNVLPLHPHAPGNPRSNRTPTAIELRPYRAQLIALIKRLEPKRVLAVGRCAQEGLAAVGIPAFPVRHPSHGGAQRFHKDVIAALAK